MFWNSHNLFLKIKLTVTQSVGQDHGEFRAAVSGTDSGGAFDRVQLTIDHLPVEQSDHTRVLVQGVPGASAYAVLEELWIPLDLVPSARILLMLRENIEYKIHKAVLRHYK